LNCLLFLYGEKRTFEETMDWFIQNGWISNVTKRGIKESVDVLSVNEDKGEVEKIAKRVGKNEIKFYDALSKVEKRLGSKYPKFLDTALKQLKQNPAKFKTNADKEEAIFQSVK
jgi:translation initiation factor 2 alpha subunit (eIF-2alpha)